MKDLNYYKDLLEKAGKAGLVAKRVWATRDGKPYQKVVWVREGDGKEVTEVETGDMISEDVLGMSIKKYSDKSVLIAGDTYGNIEKLREVKKEVGAGTFNRKLKGWVFPYSTLSTVLGKLLGKQEVKDTATETEKCDNMTQLKNSYSVGQEVNMKISHQGKSLTTKGTITELGHDGESVKYSVKINTTGKQIDNVDESEFDALPEKDNKKIEEALNSTTEATRTSVAKKVFGTVKDAILRKEIEGSSNKTGILDLQKKREAMIARLRGLATPKKSPEKKTDSTPKKKSEYSGRASITRKELDAKLKGEGMMSVTEYYQAVYGELPVFNRIETEDTDALSRAMMGNKNAEGKRGGKDEEPTPQTKKEDPEETKRGEELKKQFDTLFEGMKNSDTLTRMHHFFTPTQATLAVEDFNKYASEDVKKKMKVYVDPKNPKQIVFSRQLESPAPKPEPKTEPKKKDTDSKKRSDAMQGNQNAKKDGKKEDEPKKKETKREKIEGYDVEYTTTEFTVTGAADGNTYNVTDHTALQPKDMKQIKQKNILEQPKPNWILDIDQRAFSFNYHHLLTADAGDGNLYVSLDGFHKRNRITGELEKPNMVKMTKEHYAMTLDYYQNRQKALNKQKAVEEADRMIQKYKELYGEDTKIPNKYLKPRGKAVKTVGKNKYLFSELRFMKEFDSEFNDPTSMQSRPSGDQVQVKKLLKLKKAIEISKNNLNIAIEDYSSTYHKGKETSYGDSGTKDNLLKSHGIKVKNQDGSEIDDQEVDWIKSKMDEVFSVFGDRSSMSKDFNLKVSSARDKRQHASKAIGMFTPAFNAIGVSRVLGSQKAGFTLGHEFAHFMDYHMADKENNSRKFASHDPNHIAGKIADTFRENMNKSSNKEDKYLGSSHECFARALEQYQAMTVYGDDVVKYKDPLIGEIKYINEGSQVNAQVFNEKVRPLIEQMMKEKDAILKSMKVDIIDIDAAYKELGVE